MSKWPTVPLGEVVSHRKEFIDISDFQRYKRCRVQLHARGIVLRDQLDGLDIKTKRQQVCHSGQLLVAEIDAKHGGYGIIPDELDGAIVSSHYFLFDIDRTKLDGGFLGYYIRTPQFFDQVSAQGSTNYAAIRPGHVLEYDIPLPPLPEQNRIVKWNDAVATRLDEVTKLRQEANLASNGLMQSALKQFFEEKAETPGWEPAPLEHGAVVACGKFAHRPRNEPRFYGGNIPFIQIGDISAADQYVRKNSQTLNEQGLEISRMFPFGTVVIAITGATIGATAILGFDSCFPDSIVGIIPVSGKATSEFLYWALEYVKHNALDQATQTTQPNINLRVLNTLTIPLPSVPEQELLTERLQAVRKQISTLRREQDVVLQEAAALLPSILDQAFNLGRQLV